MTVGIFNTGNFTQDLAKKSFASMITRLMPNGTAPLFGMTSMLSSVTAVAVEHGFFTKTMLFPAFTLTADIDATQTVFNVSTTINLLPGQMHRLQASGENVIINSVISPTSISVGRGIGTVVAAAIDIPAASANAYQVGNAFEEASLRPNPLNINPVRITNLTQIYRNTWAVSGSAQSTQVIAGDTPVAENKRDCAAFHAKDIETSIFFGQKSQSTRNGMPFRTMDGLISIVGNIAYYPSSYSVPNVFTASATTNYTQLQAMLNPVFNQTTDPKVGNERVLFVGNASQIVLNEIGRLNGTYMMVDGQTSYGMQFSTFKTALGTFRMINHPLFNSNPDWAKMAIAVDLSTFNLAYLGNRKTQNKDFNASGEQATDNGIDAVGGTLTTELTAEIQNPPANAVVYGLTAAAAG